MHCVNAGAAWGGRIAPLRTAALLAVAWSAAVAPADVFHLKTGGTVTGQLVESDAEHYLVRTTAGLVRLPVVSVERIEAAATPFEEYDLRAAEAADTAEAQADLAAWCEEQGLAGERRKHLLRAVELDPDYGPARRALGYVRVGGLWVDGRRVLGRARGAGGQEDAAQSNAQRLAQAIQREWLLRIRAIKQSMLDSTLERLVEAGRARVLAIDDPLAILPLAQVLSSGHTACRALLVEMLSRFSEDEATLNLAVLGLVDPDAGIRERAVAELRRRDDPRVVAQYRDAVCNGSDALVPRAARALGQLGAVEAVPDLIGALTVGRNKWVEVPVQRYVLRWPLMFRRATVVHLGVGEPLEHLPQVGVHCGPVGFNFDQWTTWERQWVIVYRTEVLEALKRLTGENFGFEAERWRRWYEDQAARAEAAPPQ